LRVRLACVSDPHANPHGLEACLDHARERGVDGHLVAGDVVGRGPLPGETVDRVRDLGAPTVRGNVDRRVLEVEPDANAGMPKWTAARLSPGQRAYLAGLPETEHIERAGREVLLVHGSPLADTDHVFPSVTSRALERKLDGQGPDVLVCGHTHLPFHREVAGVHVVGAGTAGLPYDGDPRASYVTLDLGDEVQATVHRVDDDVNRIVDAVRERATPAPRSRSTARRP